MIEKKIERSKGRSLFLDPLRHGRADLQRRFFSLVELTIDLACIVESPLDGNSKPDVVANRSFAVSNLRGSTWMNSLRITRDYSIWLHALRVYRFELGENFVRRDEVHTAFRRFEKTKHAYGAKYFGNTLIQPRIIRNFPVHLRLDLEPTNLSRLETRARWKVRPLACD